MEIGAALDVTAQELDEAKKKGRAAYMRFYRSLRTSNCPKQIADKYATVRGSGTLSCVA